jgi:hypothetical protein
MKAQAAETQVEALVERMTGEFEALRRERERGKIVSGFTLVLGIFLIVLYLWQWKPWDSDELTWWVLWIPVGYFLVMELLGCRLYVALPTLRYKGGDAPLTGVAGEIMQRDAQRNNLEAATVLEKKSPEELTKLLNAYRHRWYQSLWIPTVLHLAAVCALVHYTGGPFDSPIAGVPAAMLIAAMLISDVGAVEVPGSWSRAIRVGVRAVWHFRLPLLLMVIAYLGLVAAEHAWPIHGVPSASELEKGLVLSITALFFTMMTYIGRASERHGAPAFKED